ARRGAGNNDVAGLQDHKLRTVPHEVGDAEDHCLGVALLARLAVHGEPQVEILRIADFVPGDEPGAEGAEGFAALALGPLAGALDLEFAFRHVIGEAVAGHRVHGGALGEITGAAADHHAEFYLVVKLGRTFRDHGVFIRTADAIWRLVEDDRLLWYL